MPEYKKLQTPLTDGESFYYPVTTYDQIIMPDGVSRWSGASSSQINDDEISREETYSSHKINEMLQEAGKVQTVNNIEPDDNQNINLSASDIGAIFADRADSEAGLPSTIDADTLGGMPSSQYALKSDIENIDIPECQLPSGGTTGQILSKCSDDDHDVQWIDVPKTDTDWSNIQNIPTSFQPSNHNHKLEDISETSIEEWVFTLEDGSTVTKKVLICD